MKFSKIKSYAKVNLVLNVLSKTSSLHKIESLVAFINLHDDIMIKKIKSKKHDIKFIGKFSKNISKKNTISTLFKILEKRKILNNEKFKIIIHKRIPNKAGLGGGSMNAANILKFLVKRKIIKIDNKKILEISKLVGSDVSLGLQSTNSIITCSNKVKYFKKCKKFHTLIVKPNFGCSTKEVYSRVREFSKPKIKKASKKMFDLNYLKNMSNSLEKIVFSEYPKLNEIKIYLESLAKPVFVRMTGSGSAIVAYFKSKERCLNAKKIFKKKYKNYWCIVSKTI